MDIVSETKTEIRLIGDKGTGLLTTFVKYVNNPVPLSYDVIPNSHSLFGLATRNSTASFGISVFPKDGEDAAEILKSADLSMYKAKEMGKNNVQLFKEYS